ncbi:type I Iterative Polyketide synthase (PKS), partial [Aspergillus brasiliensis]
MEQPALVIFGPQTSWPSSSTAERIRRDLIDEPSLAPFADAIRKIPELWTSLVEVEPRLRRTEGRRNLELLRDWVETGSFPRRDGPDDILSNGFATPFTVIAQSIEYWRCVSRGGLQSLPSRSEAGLALEGMCTGFLTAIAAAVSKDSAEFFSMAAVALRLAACIGIFVDLNENSPDVTGEARALVVRWTSPIQESYLLKTLEEQPNAYVSVLRDDTSRTITLPASEIPSTAQKLLMNGLRVHALELKGRFHHASNEDIADKLIWMSQSRTDLQFPDAQDLRIPLRRNSDGRRLYEGPLHIHAIRSLLLDQVDWLATVTAALESAVVKERPPRVLALGSGNVVPDCLIQRGEARVCVSNDLIPPVSNITNTVQYSLPESDTIQPEVESLPDTPGPDYPDNSIAIVGMACRFPGADSAEEFWDLLESGNSMLSVLPENRFPTKGLRRSPDNPVFWGNFIQDPDQFDHRFFQISSREAASMDPQQRLILQVAYQALQSSGYFDGQYKPTDTNIGCYLGVGSIDYEANIYSHQPNAYSALGSLKAFVSGRVSHYFGWTGPSITYDTACSSSVVALHSACKALLSGECTSALSGGVNIITNPALYQNLRAASFLSPTGATKAYDAAADGYSRGEGCGLFVLKTLKSALADGDQVLGVIAASAVNQTQREYGTSITAPVSTSQQALYRQVLSQAGLEPSDVTYIEAHGTGTPRGDPIECESIRTVFGSTNTGRQQRLYFGSVKGNIGHLEAGSGAAALFKSILMLQKKKIPKHVNFNKLNPQIPPLELENLAIPTETTTWDASFRAMCVVNYGAAGSNGALVLREAPKPLKATCARPTENSPLPCQLVSIYADTAESLQAYCDKLLRYLADLSERDFPDVAYKLARIQNPTHKYRLSLIARSISELRSSLAAQKHLTATPSSSATPKPVVLCFGGQSKSSVAFSKELYHSVPLFRHHLDRVEAACQASGRTIYPYIFSKEAIQDSATLQCCLFASQYACAESWIDAGIEVATVIGHSFGQISALCVCGVLSLEDAVKYVIGRASLFDIDWSTDKGTMLALKADRQMVTRLVATSQVEIACYNGPRDVVVAGSFPDIQGFEFQAKAAGIDARRLDVARAFHSSLMDPALPQLRRIANTLTFHSPQIPIQTCTQGQSWDSFGPQFLVDHSRQPVFFHDAVQRIESQFGPCTWLEAGSSSFATTLASRIASQSNSFIPVDIGDPNPTEALANATLKLQALGYNVQFWPYHRSQRDAFRLVNPPLYQFAKSKHWLEFKEFNGREKEPSPHDDQEQSSKLLLFVQFKDTERRVAEFKVNSKSNYFQACVSGHAVLGHSLCPASLYLELAAQAAIYLCEDNPPVLPQVEDLQISAPLGLNSSASIKLLLSLEEPRRWKFSLLSTTGAEDTHHASGVIQIPVNADSLASESSLYERLIGADRCNSILRDASISSINGLVYNVFGAVVDYKDFYQGVQRVSATKSEASGVVSLPVAAAGIMQDSVCDPLALDNFLQVAGIHINCFRGVGRQDVYVCTSVGKLKVYQSLEKARDQSWLVYSNTKEGGSEVLESDIFAFSEATGFLTVAYFGVRFTKVPVNSLTRVLSTLNHGKPVQRLREPTPPSPPLSDSAVNTPPEAELDGSILLRLQHLLSRVTDCPVEDILRINSLEAMGIDSLMRAEVAAEIRQEFGLDISTDMLANASTLFDLTTLISPSQTWPVPVVNTPTLSDSHTTLPMLDSTVSNLKDILSVITDIPVDEIGNDSTLDALGIDSLMRKEVQSELRKKLGRADIPENLQEYSVTSLATFLADQDGGKTKDFSIPTPTSNATLGGNFNIRELDSFTQSVASERMLKLDARPRVVKGNDGSQPFQIHSPPKVLRSSTVGAFTLDELTASFEEVKGSFDKFADISQFLNFYDKVHPRQMELATAYVVEAFRS